MTTNTPSNHRTAFLSATTLLVFTAFGSILGCKSNQPAPSPTSAAAPSPSVAALSTVPVRQPVTPPPAVKKHLYSAEADPKADIAAALKQARLEHKRVILSFGGDCQVLDIYLHQPPNAELLQKNFVLVHVDIGHFDKNLDITDKYKVPLKKGVPALAVLDSRGKLVYAQKSAEFGDMRYMYPNSVTDFLKKWKA
jgi:hypothetical protein